MKHLVVLALISLPLAACSGGGTTPSGIPPASVIPKSAVTPIPPHWGQGGIQPGSQNPACGALTFTPSGSYSFTPLQDGVAVSFTVADEHPGGGMGCGGPYFFLPSLSKTSDPTRVLASNATCTDFETDAGNAFNTNGTSVTIAPASGELPGGQFTATMKLGIDGVFPFTTVGCDFNFEDSNGVSDFRRFYIGGPQPMTFNPTSATLSLGGAGTASVTVSEPGYKGTGFDADCFAAIYTPTPFQQVCRGVGGGANPFFSELILTSGGQGFTVTDNTARTGVDFSSSTITFERLGAPVSIVGSETIQIPIIDLSQSESTRASTPKYFTLTVTN